MNSETQPRDPQSTPPPLPEKPQRRAPWIAAMFVVSCWPLIGLMVRHFPTDGAVLLTELSTVGGGLLVAYIIGRLISLTFDKPDRLKVTAVAYVLFVVAAWMGGGFD